MHNNTDEIEIVRESIDRERKNLLTALGAMAFLCICLFVGIISLGGYTIEVMSEREAVSVALDDQRRQYYRCVNDIEPCSEELVSPTSRDIKRNLESSGFAEIMYNGRPDNDTYNSDEDSPERKEAFGILGRVIYGN